MAIDDCPYSFAELASDVLPAKMLELRAHMASPIAMKEFAVRGHGPRTIARDNKFAHDISGCYVFMDSGEPIYVGISRHVFERLAQHVGRGDHLTATLAYRMAAHDDPRDGFAAAAMRDPEFRKSFDARREYLLGLDVAVVEITNPLELYIFEAYAAMELDTANWNTFATH
jgi:hypothetical protein